MGLLKRSILIVGSMGSLSLLVEHICWLWLFLFLNILSIYAADSGNESTESDDEFQICEICNSEEVFIPSLSALSLPLFLDIIQCLSACILLLSPIFFYVGKKEIAQMFLLRSTGTSCLFSSTCSRCSSC